MKPGERIKELENTLVYRENSVPNHRDELIPGWMYEKQILEHLSDLKEVANCQTRLLAVARAAEKMANPILAYIQGSQYDKPIDELLEALAAVEDLLSEPV